MDGDDSILMFNNDLYSDYYTIATFYLSPAPGLLVRAGR
jgi:hypothetical protein